MTIRSNNESAESHQTPCASPNSNPFDARHIAPGARRFVFAEGQGAAGWWARFQQAAWSGAIIGPHGSGKTTLLRELLRPLASSATETQPSIRHSDHLLRSLDLERIKLCQRHALIVSAISRRATWFHQPTFVNLVPIEEGFERRPLGALRDVLRLSRGAKWLVIDGYEQLGRRQRWQVYCARRRDQFALTVTSHCAERLPELHRCSVDLDLAILLIEQSLGRSSPWPRSEIAERLQTHHGNLREVLFELYDRWRLRPDV